VSFDTDDLDLAIVALDRMAVDLERR